MGAPEEDMAELRDRKDRLHTVDRDGLKTYNVPKRRCTYCELSGDVRVFDDTGASVTVCEDHLERAVDAKLRPPRVFDLRTESEVQISVRWVVGSWS